jgi:hypothetical protein
MSCDSNNGKDRLQYEFGFESRRHGDIDHFVVQIAGCLTDISPTTSNRGNMLESYFRHPIDNMYFDRKVGRYRGHPLAGCGPVYLSRSVREMFPREGG